MTVKAQTIFADDLQRGDTFIHSDTAWTATSDAFCDADNDSMRRIRVTQLTFGGTRSNAILRLRADAHITVIKL